MPAKVYMARDPRRDHGFTIPDPLLAKEIGAPDACRGCHSERGADWAISWVDTWYGAKMDGPARRRARAVDRARSLDRAVIPELVALARAETNVAWRASLMGLMGPFAEDPDCRAALLAALDDASPRVRAAAIRGLARFPEARARLLSLRKDPVRLVRLFAAWATRSSLAKDDAARREVERWLEIASDQPAGAIRRSELALVLGDTLSSIEWARRAVKWDPSTPSYQTLARALVVAGRPEEAKAVLAR